MPFLGNYRQYWGLLVFGNIENLVLACQGVVAGVNPIGLGILALIAVSAWLIIGTYGTRVAIRYSRVISFAGGLIIFILGLETILELAGIL